ncbi:ABC transporter permease subunit [Haloferax sp. MBLA0076]|uniref:ABC transporter permease subunit n=1 Tax=Haloferax litoreum TaxID=2666140 RepID=A0A6A8GKA0_9EURY|nr:MULTISPECIES: ABC transporter permease subunit [Haloferax]KAB1194699.1 ABC transporter permease [Haloferax sp. CBA1148]MRX23279.1 ABC transporter permease subunit [Haloferax litoreum]
MALPAVIKKDFRDSIRSLSLLTTTLLFVAFATWLATIQWIPLMYQDSTANRSTLALLNSMRQPTVFMVPLIGLSLAYDTVAGELESGTIRFLLSLPNSRAEVVFGKFVGRTAVIGVSILVGYTVAGAIALATYESFDAVVFGQYTLLTILYGTVYIGLATGFSAGMKSRTRAFVGAGALYSLFLLGWDVLLLLLQLAIYGNDIPEAGLPDWFKFVGTLNPSTAFMKATKAVIPQYGEITSYPEGSAVYLDDWVGFLILGLWCALPLVLGYLRFTTADIQ